MLLEKKETVHWEGRVYGIDLELVAVALIVVVLLFSVYWSNHWKEPIRVLGIWPDTVTGGIDSRGEVLATFDSPGLNLTPLRGDVTTSDVITFVQEKDYDVCHIGSHSSPEGIGLSRGEVVSGGWVARALRNRGIKVVVLNSCDSHSVGESLASAGIHAVITTLSDVGDLEAIRFSRAFYRSLTKSRSVSKAFNEAVLSAGPESWSMFSLIGDYTL